MLLDINSFWQGLGVVEKIYWIIAIPSSILFLIQLGLTFIGLDHDTDVSGHVDVSIDGDHGIGSQFLSFKNLLAFFTVFSWCGLACTEGGLSVAVSLIISTAAGILMVGIMVAIFYYMSRLTESGTLDLNNAIHKIGNVYLTIPAKRQGTGKIQVKVQGFQTLDALTDDSEDIKTGSVVEVIDVIASGILLVKKNV